MQAAGDSFSKNGEYLPFLTIPTLAFLSKNDKNKAPNPVFATRSKSIPCPYQLLTNSYPSATKEGEGLEGGRRGAVEIRRLRVAVGGWRRWSGAAVGCGKGEDGGQERDA